MSAGAANSPQDFQVVLEVKPASAPEAPHPFPAGLIFVSPASDEASIPTPQLVQVLSSSAAPVSYQASTATEDGNSWLSVSPSMGITSESSAAQTSIHVVPSGLAAGVYRGTVSYSLAAAATPAVNVTLIIQTSSQISNQRTGDRLKPLSARTPATASCAPTELVPTQTGLVNSFAVPTSKPTSLGIQLFDDCGSVVTNGQIAANFSNGDTALVMTQATSSGLYSAMWIPRNSGSQVTVTAFASAPGFPVAMAQISGAVIPDNSPVLSSNGTMNVFAPAAGAPLAPGTIAQIYGSGLAAQTATASVLPLPTRLGSTSVTIGGFLAPLLFVSPGQVNVQIPFELTPGQPYQVIVSNNGALTTPESVQLIAASPEVAALPSGYAIAQHASDGSSVTDAHPAQPGEYIAIYLSGMGATVVAVVSGAASPSSPASTVETPSITLNSEPVPVLFSGLTSGLVGLYQIDLQVPADAHSGDLELLINQPGYQSDGVVLPVHQ